MRKFLELFTVILFFVLIGVLSFFITDKFALPNYVRQNETVIVPEVEKLTFEEADSLLQTTGFKGIKAEERFSTLDTGIVLHQVPEAGTKTKSGRRIYLTVSSGMKPVEVPNLRGISERDAQIRIKSLNLDLKEIKRDYSTVFPNGVVSSQTLEAGVKVLPQTEIEITVSLGTPEGQFVVPNLISLPLNTAETRIAKAGLKVGRVSKIQDNEILPNTVVNQSPAADSKVLSTTKINLVVSN